jgi:hypothetical protein
LVTTALRPVHRTIDRRIERLFFAGMAFLILVSVYVGFARSYYLAGVFGAPLPNRLIHVHGAMFSLWIVLLITQTSLVTAGRVDLHRRLGVLGFGLASLMVILGLWAATDGLHRGIGFFGAPAATFYVIPVTDILTFAVLVFAAFRARFQPASHKRLIIIATIALLGAAIARWPVAMFHRDPVMMDVFSYMFLLLLVGYDLWSLRRIHRATLWASALLIVVHTLRMPFAGTALWQGFAGWVQSLGAHPY